MSRPANVQKFIHQVAAQAQAVAKISGLPASVIVAQAGVETRWGEKVVGNAYFGVKANSAYYECKAKVKFKTQESQPELSGKKQTFCSYSGFFNAALGYAEFIKASPQFATALSVKDKPLMYAAAVANAGFAGGTNKEGRENYKKILLKVIKDFDLLVLERVTYLEPIVIEA